MSELERTVLQFLEFSFPGSRLDDGYQFVAIKGGEVALIRHDRRQRVANRMCEQRCLLVGVGIDPRPHVVTGRLEERTVEYNPDWDVHILRPQWLAELPPQHIDILSLLNAGTGPGALVLIDRARRIVFDLYLRIVHAPTREALNGFLETLEDAVEDVPGR